MEAPTDSMDSLIKLSEHGVFDTVLHYALLLGAIFQLVCILAVILVPPRERDEWPGDQIETEDGHSLVGEGEADKKPVKHTAEIQTTGPTSRTRRSENKKRR